MKKDLLIVDIQNHYTLKGTEKYIKELSDYFKKNQNDIENINLVIDLKHESNPEQSKFDFDNILNLTGGYEDYSLYQSELISLLESIYNTKLSMNDTNEIESLIQEDEDILIQFDKYVIEYRIPMKLAKILIILERKKNIKVNPITKEFGYYRDMIDNNIELYPYILKMYYILSVDKEIDPLCMNLDTMKIEIEKDSILKNIYTKIMKEFDIRDDELLEEFNECFLYEDQVEREEEKYLDMLNDLKNPLECFGGGAMECFYEELTSIYSLMDYHNINENEKKIIINYDLIYGDISNRDNEDYQEKNIKSALYKFKKRYKECSKPIKSKKKNLNKVKL